MSQGTEGISDDFNQLCDAISAEDDDENDALRKSKSTDAAIRRSNTANVKSGRRISHLSTPGRETAVVDFGEVAQIDMPAIHTSPMIKTDSHKDFSLPDASAAASNGKVPDQDCSNILKD